MDLRVVSKYLGFLHELGSGFGWNGMRETNLNVLPKTEVPVMVAHCFLVYKAGTMKGLLGQYV